MPGTITIELKNLHLFASHGWHEEEAILGNEFEVTIRAFFPADEVFSLGDTVDYVTVYAIVKELFSEREKLLETVAQKIAAALKKEFAQLQNIEIAVTKLSPPISSFTGTVGITYRESF